MSDEFLSKFRGAFGDRVVYKDLQTSGFLMSLNLPSFMRDWLLSSFQSPEGMCDNEKLTDFVHAFLPDTDRWYKLKAEMVTNGRLVRLIAKIRVEVDVRTSTLSFALPDYDLKSSETRIDSHVWEKYKAELVSGR
ncbi:MAG: BREX system Lon protease-like protein BrxL, partial [Planctomycetia bacterium]|nr:BREX system Lon protease-like protein BrxL [Planctomycetia bacterium]